MTTKLSRAVTLLKAPGNSLGFAARRVFRWSRGLPTLRHQPKSDLFDYLEGAARERAAEVEGILARRYGLADLAGRSERWVYRDNLALLQGLERVLADDDLPDGRGTLQAVDVGSGDWHYVFGLHRFLARHRAGRKPRPVQMVGIEVDGHGVYRDLHSRADHARAFAAQTREPRVQYRVADFCKTDVPRADVVTLLFPFVTVHALLAWGLPLGLCRPRSLLRRTVQVVRPGGLMVVFNQTQEEHARLLDSVAELPVEVVRSVPLPTDLVDYREDTRDRVGILLRRTAALR